MTKYQEIAHEVRNEHKFNSWDELFEEAAKRYATQVAENLREEILKEIGTGSFWTSTIKWIKEIKIILP